VNGRNGGSIFPAARRSAAGGYPPAIDPARILYLTFDDGPWPGGTPAVLDVLRAHGVRATFFVIGRNVLRCPELVARMAGEGHAVGNHSHAHPLVGWLRGVAYWRDQIERADDAVVRAGVVRPVLFRPPMGVATRAVREAAAGCGKSFVLWNRRAVDGIPTTARAIVRRLLPCAAGDVLLMHDGVPPVLAGVRRIGATVAALPVLIRRARAEGFEFGRM